MGVEGIVNMMRSRLEGRGFNRSVKFDLGENGVIMVNGGSVSSEDGVAECTISISQADLEEMIAGDLDPMTAFMSGKISVDGDMSVAMELSQAI